MHLESASHRTVGLSVNPYIYVPAHDVAAFLSCSWCPLQLVGTFCKGLLPGLLPLVWSIALLKV